MPLKSNVMLSAATVAMLAPAAFAERVLFIDSYHEGYAWSDGITDGVAGIIEGAGHELRIHRMDTKRNGSEEFKQQAATDAMAVIEEFQPDVVIATDDNASKYIIMPHYKDAALPFVFAGVNWDASVYGFPYANVTGMIEVSPTNELVGILQSMAAGARIGFLAADTASERKEVENLERLFDLNMDVRFVATFSDWQEQFIDLQSSADMMVVGVAAGINDFDNAAAAEFAVANTQIPSGSYQSSMREISLLGFEKVAHEQGRWAAEAALNILNGASPADIEIARNVEGYLVVNGRIAEQSGLAVPDDLVEAADMIIE